MTKKKTFRDSLSPQQRQRFDNLYRNLKPAQAVADARKAQVTAAFSRYEDIVRGINDLAGNIADGLTRPDFTPHFYVYLSELTEDTRQALINEVVDMGKAHGWKIRFGTEERATGQCYIVFLEFDPDKVVT